MKITESNLRKIIRGILKEYNEDKMLAPEFGSEKDYSFSSTRGLAPDDAPGGKNHQRAGVLRKVGNILYEEERFHVITKDEVVQIESAIKNILRIN